MHEDNQNGTQATAGDRLRHEIEGGWLDLLGEGIFCLYRDGQSIVVTREDAKLILGLQ